MSASRSMVLLGYSGRFLIFSRRLRGNGLPKVEVSVGWILLCSTLHAQPDQATRSSYFVIILKERQGTDVLVTWQVGAMAM